MRSRRILQDAHDEGRPCPSQLTQTKPCPIRPCYTWVLSEWSSCTVEVRTLLLGFFFLSTFLYLLAKEDVAATSYEVYNLF